MTFAEYIKQNSAYEYNTLLLYSLNASKKYFRFQIDKRDGSKRNIYHPAKQLKEYQRFLLKHLFNKLSVHTSVYSYRKKISIKDMVEQHKYNNYMIRIDFKDFFPSIKNYNIRSFLQKSSDSNLFPFTLSELDLTMILSMVCRNKCLTIGAVSSPQITNVLLYDFDTELANYCNQKNITYTRYADDLFFSTKQPNILNSISDIISKIIKSTDLKLVINISKTYNSSKKHRKTMTGLVLTSDNKISIGLSKKNEIKTQLYQLSKGSTIINKASLGGYLSYIKSVEPTFLETLKRKYGALVISLMGIREKKNIPKINSFNSIVS